VQNADLKKDVNIGLSGGCWDQWEENERRWWGWMSLEYILYIYENVMMKSIILCN
jgi:hypothetical protein